MIMVNWLHLNYLVVPFSQQTLQYNIVLNKSVCCIKFMANIFEQIILHYVCVVFFVCFYFCCCFCWQEFFHINIYIISDIRFHVSILVHCNDTIVVSVRDYLSLPLLLQNYTQMAYTVHICIMHVKWVYTRLMSTTVTSIKIYIWL